MLVVLGLLILSVSCLCLVFSHCDQSRMINLLKHKLYLHEEKIVLLSNELEICRIYLRDHCMFCMYDMDSDRREEETK